MEMWLIYLWLRLDALQAVFIVTIIFGGIAVAISSAIFYIEESDLPWSQFGIHKPLGITLAIAITLSVFLPSSKDVAIMVGAHYAIKASESPEAAKLVTLMRLKADQLLDEAIDEAGKKGEKK